MSKDDSKPNYRIFWKTNLATTEPQEVLILSHGSSGGPQNSLISYLAATLPIKAPELMIVTPLFSFFVNGGKPSNNLSKESDEIKLTYDDIRSKYPKATITLAGKSIGGIASLVFDKRFPNIVKKIFVLGWPMKIGYPINLELLTNDDLKMPDYLTQYRDLLNSINAKVTFIQGDQDDLADISECKAIIEQTNQILDVVSGANHSFESPNIKDKNYFSECGEIILKSYKEGK